ncbi:MAG: hypothetical protein FJ100_09705 [Deltaproteobacteria bacterium]|nr:hypothetical protein [Deltaproteobacteria bacterium]
MNSSKHEHKADSKPAPEAKSTAENPASAAAGPADTATQNTQAQNDASAPEGAAQPAADAAKGPFGAWAVPTFAHFANLPGVKDLPELAQTLANNLGQIPQVQQLPGMALLQQNLEALNKLPTVQAAHQAVQAATRQQIDQVHKVFEEVAAQEARAADQFKSWLGEVHKLQVAGLDYAMALQTEARKLAKAQLDQMAKAIEPQTAAKPDAKTDAKPNAKTEAK